MLLGDTSARAYAPAVLYRHLAVDLSVSRLTYNE